MKFLEKVRSSVHFCYSFSKACFFGISFLHFLKDSFENEVLNNLKCSHLLQTKKLVILCKNVEVKMVLIYLFATKYWFRATHHLNVEAIFSSMG